MVRTRQNGKIAAGESLLAAMPAGIFIEIAISDGYHGIMKVSVANAKNKLPELIKAVEKGEAVTICRRGVPVVDLVPTKATNGKKPRFGTLRGRIIEVDPDWWKPMTDEEAEAFIEGRF